VLRVGETRTRSRLHFDWQQLPACFDHEVDLISRGSAPVCDLCPFLRRIAPRKQIMQYDVFQMRAFRLGNLCDMQGETDVSPVDLRGLDQSFRTA
jgi:hypothetical protein